MSRGTSEERGSTVVYSKTNLDGGGGIEGGEAGGGKEEESCVGGGGGRGRGVGSGWGDRRERNNV